MQKPAYRIVTRSQGNVRALKAGEIALPGFDLAFEEVEPLPRAFRRMVRELAWDISEMALATFILARAHGVPITGLPVFPLREFHHKSIVVSRRVEIAGPKDLEGRRLGVNRGFTVTGGVWARAILAEELGLDLDTITWARSDDEHVPDWPLPANVEDLGGMGTLEEQLARGDLPAAVGLPGGDGTRPLLDDPFAAGLAALKTRGFYPINHLMVIRTDVLAEAPGLALHLCDAFAASKRVYLDDLTAGRIADPTPMDGQLRAVLDATGDPLPHGLEANAGVLEDMMRHMVAQRIIDAPLPLDSLFAPQTLGFAG